MAGGFYFFALIAVISTMALMEFYRLTGNRGAKPQVIPGIVFGLCINSVFVHEKLQYVLLEALESVGVAVPLPSMHQAFLILFLLFVPAMMLRELFRREGTPVLNLSTTLLGVCYVSVFLGSLIGLRELFVPSQFPVFRHFEVHGIATPPEVVSTIHRWGGYTVASVFAAIWICDSLAYFIGSRWGRRKLMERVSPGKTWEGAFAGCIGAVLSFVVARELLLPYMSVATAIICGVIVGVIGQLGDLVESMVKRDSGVKDSSGIIPGHGGVLDRFDSLLMVSPVLYFYLDFIVF